MKCKTCGGDFRGDGVTTARACENVDTFDLEPDSGPHHCKPARRRTPLERAIERYLVVRVKNLGGEVRKVQWVGRRDAPDRVVMLPASWRGRRTSGFWDSPTPIWVELKNPETILTFPANAHERAQAREHERMRRCGQRVVVIGTFQQVDELLS